jgi:Holliday junction resolvasome RuvABC endonuclease subunit
MAERTHPDRVLAIAPTTRGFAFVVFEGPLSPFDWGIHRISGANRNARILKNVERLVERYHPEVIVLEDVSQNVRRTARIKALNLAIRHLGESAGLDVRCRERAAIRRCFVGVGARTKVEIAHAIARMIPAFSHRLPPVRKIWMTEDRRQSLFDAAALGLTHYAGHDAQGSELP